MKKKGMNRFLASILCISYVHSITSGFCAGTLVKTEASPIPIEQLILRTLVTCYDISSHETKIRPVMRILKQKVSRYKRIHIGATGIDTSYGQLFYVPLKQSWIASQYLNVGDTLLTSNNTYLVIDSIEQINEEADIYEISVFEYRNMYISDQEILVHNLGGVVGVALWYGGGLELSAYGALSICGLIIGGVAALCKEGKGESNNQEHNVIPQESIDIDVQPIIGYQPPYSDKPIDLTATILPPPNVIDALTVQSIIVESLENNEQGCVAYPVTDKAITLINPVVSPDDKPMGCFNPADVENALISKPTPSVESEQILVLMAKNNNKKKPKKTDESNQQQEKKIKEKEEEDKIHPHGKYIGANYHHKNSKSGRGKGAKSPAPKDGQAALDNSVECPKKVTSESDRRVGVSQDEIVVLDQTREGEYHGHVESWDELHRHVQKALENSGLTKNGKIQS